jgi:hypothetical protein
MKLDILVRIQGFHLPARAETSPDMDRVTPPEPIAPCHLTRALTALSRSPPIRRSGLTVERKLQLSPNRPAGHLGRADDA